MNTTARRDFCFDQASNVVSAAGVLMPTVTSPSAVALAYDRCTNGPSVNSLSLNSISFPTNIHPNLRRGNFCNATSHQPTKFRNSGMFKVSMGNMIREHSGSDTEHWTVPSQRCSPQDHKLDSSDCQWPQQIHALELSRGGSELQS